MGILPKIGDRRKKGTTKGFYFGATEAEAENKEGQSLLDYFEDYLSLLPLLRDGRYLFIGRKGSGKSAIAKYIKDLAEEEEDSFADLIGMHDLELEKVIQSDAFEKFQNKEAIIFEWLILVRIIKLIIKNDSAKYTKEYSKLKKFLDRNSGIVNIDKYQIQEIVKSKDIEVTFEPLRHAFGGIFKNHFGTKTFKAPFQNLIPALREIVETIVKYDVNKDKEFWLLFDDLDITFQEDESKQKMITELLRMSKKYNTSVFSGTETRILVFLRDDIKRIIESKFPDTAKLFSSYEIIIKWYDHDIFKMDENMTKLKSFVNRRIELNFKNHELPYDVSNPWSSLFHENYQEYQDKSSFKYLLDFTFYRPRDLILFLSNIGLNSYTHPLDSSTVKLLLRKYIQANIVEIKNELGLNFNENEKSLIFDKVFPYLVKHPHTTIDKFCEEISKMKFEKDGKEIFELLKSYGLLAFKDQQGKLFFEHRGAHLSEDELKKVFITLPKCIYHDYVDIP